jgi:hypothetical protein
MILSFLLNPIFLNSMSDDEFEGELIASGSTAAEMLKMKKRMAINELSQGCSFSFPLPELMSGHTGISW